MQGRHGCLKNPPEDAHQHQLWQEKKGGPMGTHTADKRAPGKVPGALKVQKFV
jgi:hypothetical protein